MCEKIFGIFVEICGDNSTMEGEVLVERRGMTRSCVWDRAQSTPCRSEYREITGRCTNLINDRKTWGMSNTPYTRVLQAKYEDGMC